MINLNFSGIYEILEITGLTEKRKAMPATLSGGQQQRVAIARAILGNPSIILADEPTGNLDSKSTTEIMELFARLNKEKGLTILQVTHSEKCAKYGTRTILLDSGKIVGGEGEQAAPAEEPAASVEEASASSEAAE